MAHESATSAAGQDDDIQPHMARFDALGVHRLTSGDGRSQLTWTPTAFASNSRGHVHGGLVGSIIDDCSAMAVHSAVGEPVGTPTVSMHIDYLRPLVLGQSYTCRGAVLRVGGRLAVADTTIEDADGQVCVRGTATFALVRGQGPG